ncbi:MAG: lysylphosphatidylglycerol synthase domain-containing protein, partial [Jiangellaceae bacterium]
MRRKSRPPLRVAGLVLGAGALVAAAFYLAGAAEAGEISRVVSAVLADPAGLVLALGAYAAAFALRAWAWQRALPGLSRRHAWSALHVSLLGNHVLPLRLGEVLRVTSVQRRTELPLRPVAASAVTLRAADVLAVLGLAAVAAPAVLLASGWWSVAVVVAAGAFGA